MNKNLQNFWSISKCFYQNPQNIAKKAKEQRKTLLLNYLSKKPIFWMIPPNSHQKIPFLVPDPSLGMIPSVLVYSMHPRRHGTLVSRIPKGLLCVAFADSTIYCLHTEPVDSFAWTIILRLDNNIQCFIKRKKVKKQILLSGQKIRVQARESTDSFCKQ